MMRNVVSKILESGRKKVFFDIFDTIVAREVEPEYVKKIWAKRVSVQFEEFISYIELYRYRNVLEAHLCQVNTDNGMDSEFNYKSLLMSLYDKLIEDGKLTKSVTKDEFCQKASQIEIETELSVQIIDKDWIEAVKELKHLGLEIYCVSDFYLNKEMITELFVKHNIDQFIDYYYVSSEYLLTKRSGRLYKYILDEQDLNTKDIIMIGDNLHSDYDMPSSLGMAAYHLDREEQHAFYKEFINTVSSSQYYKQAIHSLAAKTARKSTFLEIAFSLFYYLYSLHKELVMRNVKDVFFFSREGEFLLQLFEIYQQKEGYKKVQHINAHYMKVSRKATFLPSLKSLQEEDFQRLFRQYIHLSIYEFLSSLNMSEKDIKQLSIDLNMDIHQKIDNFPQSSAFENLKNNSIFIEIFESNRIEQNHYFKEYFDQCNAENTDTIHVVDVGWKGTIQDNIYEIFRNKKIEGYYLGLIAPGNMHTANMKRGLLFSSIPYRSPFYDVFNENRALYEVILGASHGSANRYVKKDDKIEVETFQTEKEQEIFSNIIQPLQKEILIVFNEICDIFCRKDVKLDEYLADFAKVHARMTLFPTKKEIDFFSKLYHYENFGVFEYSTFSNKSKFSLTKTMVNSLKLAKNPHRILSQGFWGPTTLQNAGLGYLIPLYGRYKFAKIFKNNTQNNDNHNEKKESKFKKILNEKNDEIKHLLEMITERDEAIKAMTKMIDDRDEAIQAMTKMIDDRDKIIKNFENRLPSKD
ncbi:HAD-IA family hydrolase [Paenibacillus campi]|uniref:HAD-IA family hydrolase n=1 Tax=Paenibacillus campi TaxID=3106031 RepID=UPI002AFF9F55|nr:HAD-IA family hydrolase [Paenibacillus sp. SGZ-1009]